MNVEANYGWEKNDEKENVYCNYDSIGSNSCYFGAETCVDGRVGARCGGMNASEKRIRPKFQGVTRTIFNHNVCFCSGFPQL